MASSPELDRSIHRMGNAYTTGHLTRTEFLQWFCQQALDSPLALNVAALVTSSSTPQDDSTMKEMLRWTLWRTPRVQ